MSRIVSIKKVGAATIVDIADTESANEKRVYNKTTNVYSSGNTIIVQACYPFPDLRINFNEISDKLSTANADAYIEEIVKSTNGFFNSNVVIPEAV